VELKILPGRNPQRVIRIRVAVCRIRRIAPETGHRRELRPHHHDVVLGDLPVGRDHPADKSRETQKLIIVLGKRSAAEREFLRNCASQKRMIFLQSFVAS